MYFSLLLDESGKIKQGEYTSLCGYFGTVPEFDRFGTEWANEQVKWDVPALHMSRIMFPDRKNDEWTAVWRKKGDQWIKFRDHILKEFCLLIANSNLASVGSVVDAATYREIRNAKPEDFLLAHADCNVFLFQHAVMAALDKVERVDKIGMLTVGIDDDQGTSFEYYNSYWNLKRLIEHPKIPAESRSRFERMSRRVDQLAFCNEAFHPALQAADLLAYVSRRCFAEPDGSADQAWFRDLYEFLTRGGTHPVQIYRGENLRKIAGNTARTVREVRREANCVGL